MFKPFRSKEAEELNHWILMAENFHQAPLEFYEWVEKELVLRKVPGLEITRVEFAEGSILSDKRIYLRMLRERLVFDICVAPFGTSSFFSCRMAEIPKHVSFWQLFMVVAGLFSLLYIFVKVIGFFLGPIAFLGSLIFLIYVLRNAVALGLQDLDRTLMQSPVLGGIYEAWFHKETNYRKDTRLMYLDTVSHLVRKVTEDVTAQKGVKLVRAYENAPILGELYRPCK